MMFVWFRWHVAACRCIFFHSEGLCLYSGMQDSLKVFGWEPARSYDTVAMGWGKVADISIAQNQLVRQSVMQFYGYQEIIWLCVYIPVFKYVFASMHPHTHLQTSLLKAVVHEFCVEFCIF